jgi:hypothetical protein
LKLPKESLDFKTWIIPLLIHTLPNIKSFGETLVLAGIKLASTLGLVDSKTYRYGMQQKTI